MAELIAGANMALPGGPVSVSVDGPFDLSALVLGPDGQVDGDGDFVFYNQPAAAGVALRGSVVTVDPTRLRPGADRVVLVASPEDARTPFGRLTAPAVGIRDGRGATIARFRPAGLTSETVVQLAEIYRRDGRWKLRALGQGYADGLAGLARDFGVEVDDEPAASRPARPVPSWPTPVGRSGGPGGSAGHRPAGSGGPGGRSGGVASANAPGAAGGSEHLLREVIDLTNAERASAGLGPLSPEPRLRAAAQGHSADMVARDFFAHDNPDGASVADRVTAVGYAYSVVAENIAAGQTTAAEVVQGWMNSPGHRANILNPQVRQIGVGLATGGGYGTYWTQVFGTQR